MAFCAWCGNHVTEVSYAACPRCDNPTNGSQRGIVAIIYAAQVNSKLHTGDIAGAQAASKNAKMWCWIALGAAALVWLAYSAFVATSIATSK